MSKEPIYLSREALYIRVWETPTVKLAKELGISDVAIGKICKKLEIPKPPLGFWRRVETGFRKKIPPLTKPTENIKPGVWIYPKLEEKTLVFEDEYKKQNLLIEERLAEKLGSEELPKIKVSKNLYKPHPLVSQTQKAFSNKNVDTYGALSGTWDQKYLNLRVSKKHLNRSLRIMDALIKAIEKCGCKVSILKNHQMETEVAMDDIKITISLKEDFKRFERKLSEEQQRSIFAPSRYYYEPTGNFTFSIDSYVNTRNKWRDTETSPLEEQLNDIIIGILRAIEFCRQKEIERKKEERLTIETAIQREKDKILRKREQECRNFLEELAKQWQKARKFTTF